MYIEKIGEPGDEAKEGTLNIWMFLCTFHRFHEPSDKVNVSHWKSQDLNQ